MTQEEIIEGNKLIAEFMELPKCTDIAHINNPCYYLEYNKRYTTFEDNYKDLKYHSSWDWIMNAVEKIESISIKGFEKFYNHEDFEGEGNFNVIIQQGNCVIRADLFYYQPDRPVYGLSEFSKTSKIEALWLAVVEILKWLNKNK